MTPEDEYLRRGISVSALEHDIVQHMLSRGAISRNQLAIQFGLSRSSITKATTHLQNQQILIETEVGASNGGRRPRLLDVNKHFGYIIGINMGASGTSVCVTDFIGGIQTEGRLPLQVRNGSPEKIMDEIFQCIFVLLQEADIPPTKVYGVGVGVPAPVYQETGAIVSPANMIGWDAFDIPAYCRAHFPNAIAKLENDVNMMALGELKIGNARGHDNIIFVKIGTGVGSSVVMKGEIYRGSTGVAGHIGHVSIDRNGPVCGCGNVGCLERYVSGPAIAQKGMQAAQEGNSPLLAQMMAKQNGQLTSEDIGAAAAQGDRSANDIIVESGETIGRVLATLISFFNPSLVVIGGGVSNIGPQFMVAIHRAILQYSLPLSTKNLVITKSELGDTAGMIGAVTLALDDIFIRDLN